MVCGLCVSYGTLCLSSTVLLAVIDLVDEGGMKALVFAHHGAVLDVLEAAFTKAKLGLIRIDGSVPAELRHALVNDFQNVRRANVAPCVCGWRLVYVTPWCTEPRH